METAEKIIFLKNWLGSGSINIFGLPMSGKDTVGKRLAEVLEAKFLSSGDIIRSFEAKHHTDLTGNGVLAPTNAFYDIVLPYFSHADLSNSALILSSIGRWSGEEDSVMEAAKNGGHEIKVVVNLDLTENEAKTRFEVAKTLGDRGERLDDSNLEIFETRLKEFHEKTLPVINHYEELGRLVKVDAGLTREEVFDSALSKLYDYAVLHPELSNEEIKTI